MAEQNKSEKYAYLDQLSTERLEELIRADIESPDNTNDKVIFHILEVMEKREREHPTSRLIDVDEAWAEFQQHYNTPEGEGLSLYPTGDEDTEESESHATAPIISISITRPRRWLKNALIAAAAITVLMVGMVGAQAAGIDVFGAIGRWTEETFHFVTSASGAAKNDAPQSTASDDNATYVALQAALDDCGITEKLIPTQYPEGFEASDPKISNTDFGTKISCNFSEREDKSFSIQIWRYNKTADIDSRTFEKDSDAVQYYTAGGKTFFILSNMDTTTATWSDNHSLVLKITGNISEDDINVIIDSIGGAST